VPGSNSIIITFADILCTIGSKRALALGDFVPPELNPPKHRQLTTGKDMIQQRLDFESGGFLPLYLIRQNLIRQIPNSLSVLRILLALLFPFAPADWRIPIIGIALLSEFLDGFLARALHAVTKLGQVLDPIADKLFVASTVLVLIFEQRLTWTHFSLIAMRDIVVAVGALSLAIETRGRLIRFMVPKVSGKITTALQFTLLISLFANTSFSAPLLIVTAVSSCVSAIDYLYDMLHRKFDLRATKAF
jgi:phosphatidylglycerophosphate synthase